MIARITPRRIGGTICAIPSKSEAHRALICAALADKPTRIPMDFTSEDIEATIRCLTAFGAKIEKENGMLMIVPIDHTVTQCTADCGESGSTLRFLLPVAGALGIETSFVMHGRLPQRPMTALEDAILSGGCRIDRPEENVLRISGKLKCGSYTIPGNISSQYITGLLLALTVLEGQSRLEITGTTESADYIQITLREMYRFGAYPEKTEYGYAVQGRGCFETPGETQIGGDWSNAAFWLAAGSVEVIGLDTASAQGDKRIADVIGRFDECRDECVLDASPIPDLVPAVAAYACVHGKKLRVINAQRLRLKESDRISSVVETINALGGDARETDDGMLIDGTAVMNGGRVDAQGDHRIAMMAAILSIVCRKDVVVGNAGAVRKSYPLFWQDFAGLGGAVTLVSEE